MGGGGRRSLGPPAIDYPRAVDPDPADIPDELPPETVELLGRAQDGDRDAQRRLFVSLRQHLLQRVRGHPGARLLARWQYADEDVVGEVWRVVFSRSMLDRFEPRGSGSLRRYLASAVDGVVKDLLDRVTADKRGGLERPAPLAGADSSSPSLGVPPGEGPGPATAAGLDELYDRAEALLEGVQREVWRLRVREELDFAAIGDRLGLSEDAARSHARRARERLQASGLLDSLPG